MNELFPTNFLEAIEQLSLDVSRIASTGASGSHLSREAGSSLDFRDYRSYSPGDDLRRVDWNVFRRTGHLFLRRFEQPSTVPIHLLIDNSESMFVENPNRFTSAARIAAAISSAALRLNDPLSILPLGNQSINTLHRVTGRRRWPDVLQFLSELKPSGAGSFTTSVRESMRLMSPNGLVFVISDFFDDAGAHNLVETLALIPNRMMLIQIVQPFDADPSLTAEVQLIDCENASEAMVMPGSDIIERYRHAYIAYQSILDSFAFERGVRHERLDASADTFIELEKLFPAGSLHLGEVHR